MPYVISTILGAVINFVINCLLIPKFAAVGAMIGTVCAEFTLFFVQAFFVRKEFPTVKYVKSALGFVPIGMVMCVTVYTIGASLGVKISTLVLQVFAGVIIYVLLSLIYLWIIKDPFMVNFVKHITKKK